MKNVFVKPREVNETIAQYTAPSEHSIYANYYFVIIIQILRTFTNPLNLHWNLLLARQGAWCWQYLDE